jgi:hypothetical protein
MFSHPKQNGHLSGELNAQRALTLIAEAIAHDGRGNGGSSKADRIVRFHRLMDAGAWTEAALALIEIEQPAWKLRRLAYEDGEWFCSLSRRPSLPAELDETSDAHHEVLPLAILQACLEAQGRTAAKGGNGSARVPQVRPELTGAICFDNFG